MNSLKARKPNQSVDGEIYPENHVYEPENKQYGGTVGVGRTKPGTQPPNTWQDYLFAPFNNTKNPGILSAILVGLLTWLCSFMFGLITILALDRAIASGLNTVLIAISVGAVQMGLIFLISCWTYEEHLPTFVFPEYPLFTVVTGRLGLIPAAIQSSLSFVGYITAGYALRSLIGGGVSTNNVTNIATGQLSYVLYWVGGSFVMLNWMWNNEFSIGQTETGRQRHHRAVVAMAVSVFVLVVAFYGDYPGHGLVFYSPGPYVAGLIYRNSAGGPDFGANSIALFSLVGLLAVPATIAILYWILQFMTGYMINKDPANKGYAPVVNAGNNVEATNKSSLLQRPININY